MSVTVQCPLCGNDVEVSVTRGEPMVRYYANGDGYPGSGPEAEITDACECLESEFVDESKLAAHLMERAIEKGADCDPLDDGDAAYEAARDEGRF